MLSSGFSLQEALQCSCKTWSARDGVPMVDYSQQAPGQRPGTHIEHIQIQPFVKFLQSSRPFDFDVMLEIKDKEKSACVALRSMQKLGLAKL